MVLGDVFEIIHIVGALMLHSRKLVLPAYLLGGLVMITISASIQIFRFPNLGLTTYRIHACVRETGPLAELSLHRGALTLTTCLPVLSVFVGPDDRVIPISLDTLEALLAVNTFTRVSKVHLDACWPVRAKLLRESIRLDVVRLVEGAFAAKLPLWRANYRGPLRRRFVLGLGSRVTALGIVRNGLFGVRIVKLVLLAGCLVENVVVHVHVQVGMEIAPLLAQHRYVVDL